MSVKLISK